MSVVKCNQQLLKHHTVSTIPTFCTVQRNLGCQTRKNLPLSTISLVTERAMRMRQAKRVWVVGRFVPSSVRPLDVSPPRRLASRHSRPIRTYSTFPVSSVKTQAPPSIVWMFWLLMSQFASWIKQLLPYLLANQAAELLGVTALWIEKRKCVDSALSALKNIDQKCLLR